MEDNKFVVMADKSTFALFLTPGCKPQEKDGGCSEMVEQLPMEESLMQQICDLKQSVETLPQKEV